jgi:lipopolysaccharide transport system ATP-binding protein
MCLQRLPDIMIRAENIHKTFKLYCSPVDRLKEAVFRKSFHRLHHALNGVSFEVAPGETLGIVGQNGAGKSTLLKILTGVLLPDSGHIEISGKITGLLELGTGFNTEFSGVENIYLNGTLLGLSRKEVAAKMDRIVGFSELGEFIREPLKTYSSGMFMRLAFSIAIHADPQAFVVDEALSVGDIYFQQKCMKKIKEFREQGGSIIFVSHELNSVKVLCDRAMLLDRGSVIEYGNPSEVINYFNFLMAKKAQGEEVQLQSSACAVKSYGNLKIEFGEVRLLNGQGQPSGVFISGEPCSIAINLIAHESVDDVTVGILIRDRFGQDIFGTNTNYLHIPICLESGQGRRITYLIPELNLGPGKYTLSVAAHRDISHLYECYQWVDVVYSFEVVTAKDFQFIGLSRLKPVVKMQST